MHTRIASVAVMIAVAVVSRCVVAVEDADLAKTLAATTRMTDEVTQHGITWKFDKPMPVGQFVNGDYYVVGAATVVEITPKPVQGAAARTGKEKERADGKYARNGSALNLKPGDRAGFDSRLSGTRYDPALFQAPPIKLQPGDSLTSTISVNEVGDMPRMMRPENTCVTPVRTAAVLTCLAEAAPADAFRPSLHGPMKGELYLARNLRRDLLPKLAIPPGLKKGQGGVGVLGKVTPSSWDQTDPKIWQRVFERPWIDICFDGYVSPIENMPQYGREVARAAGLGGLNLCLDIDAKEKEKLLVNMVQTGIDLWGSLQAGYPGWPAHGGHGHGRKLLIVLAGYMLNDADMMSPYKLFPNAKFSEDMQTMYGQCWTGARVMYAGHVGKDGMKGKIGWGLYEDKPPSAWEDPIGENYRRCCTGHCWVAEAMVIRLLKMEKVWDHQAFLDYCDRWMNEDDTEFIKKVKEAKGWDYTAEHGLQRQTWDPLATAMYKTYRGGLGPMAWQGEK